MENKWTDVSYCVFKSSFCTPALWNHLTVGGKRVRSCLTWAERTGKDRKCLSEARGGGWNGTGTDFKGQCCLYCPTPFFFFSRVVFEKCEKKRQQEKVMERWWEADNDWDSQESPPTLTDCLFVFVPRLGLANQGAVKHLFRGSVVVVCHRLYSTPADL